MQNYKPVATLVETSIKLIADSDGSLVDATLYKQIVSSMRYLCLIYITYGVGLFNIFMEKPTTSNL